MVRSDREGIGEAESELWSYLWEREPSVVSNDRFAVGEVVRVKGPTKTLVGVIIKPFGFTGLHIMFPQFDVPQLIRAVHVEKLNED
jgi:hypothetical protein